MLTRRSGTLLLVAPFALVALFRERSKRHCSRERPRFRTTCAARRSLEFRPGMSKEDVDHLLRQYKLEHHYDGAGAQTLRVPGHPCPHWNQFRQLAG